MIACSSCGTSGRVTMSCAPGSEPVAALGFPIDAGQAPVGWCLACWWRRFGGAAGETPILDRVMP